MPVKIFKNTLETKSNFVLASCHLKVGNKRGKSKIKDISLASLKLTVALELKAEGYTHIEFDKVVELNDLKVRVHVLGEDELGTRLAVLCINRLEKFNSSGLADAVEAVQRALGEEGDVAIAISISLLEEARDLFGITNRVFLVDHECRVWSHSCDNAYVKMIKYAMMRQHGENRPSEGCEGVYAASWRAQQFIEYVV
ncbi:MAG: hypothetical protein QXL91_02070 [Candidatus Bathyarchaeia archaeon]